MASKKTVKPSAIERRFVPFESAELRFEPSEDGIGRTEGYVALYDTWSPVYGDFRERIAPGFFDEALEKDDIRFLRDHREGMVLARNKAGTLELESDETGLMHRAELADVTYARDLVVSMKRGDVTGASFAFSLPAKGGDTWEQGEDGVMERTLVRAERVYDVSVVTFPFYPETDLALKSLRAWRSKHEVKHSLDGVDWTRMSTSVTGAESFEPVVIDNKVNEVERPHDKDLEDLKRRLALFG